MSEMHKENNGGRNLSAVLQCGIFTVIKIFWLTLAENICWPKLSKQNIIIGKFTDSTNISTDTLW